MLLFGILEGGRVLMLNQTMRSASSVGSRQATIQGSELSSDYRILQSIKGGVEDRIPTDEISRVIVFKATIAGQPNRFLTEVPASCLSGPVTGLCNVYTGADFSLTEAQLASCTSPSKARYWCPSNRKSASLSTDGNGPPDWIGVYIEAEVPLVTKLFGDSLQMTDTRIGRIESTSLR